MITGRSGLAVNLMGKKVHINIDFCGRGEERGRLTCAERINSSFLNLFDKIRGSASYTVVDFLS